MPSLFDTEMAFLFPVISIRQLTERNLFQFTSYQSQNAVSVQASGANNLAIQQFDNFSLSQCSLSHSPVTSD